MLDLKNISFSYGSFSVLKDISLKVKVGQLVALTGVSGSGKSTLLKLIYGGLTPNNGSISWKKEAILGPDYNLLPGAPYMKYLAQDFDLMPYTSVVENISQHLSVFEPEELENRTKELLALIDLEPFAHVQVKHLSGGQQQRVALAKVIAKTPELLLLDEPFSHIDPPLKFKLRNQLFQYLKKYKIACILASHHPEDYMGHAQKMFCLKEGRIVAHGSPKRLYENPPSVGVAQLFGTVNIIGPVLIKKHFPTLINKEKGSLLVWPHEWRVSPQKGTIEARVTGCFFKGDGYQIVVKPVGYKEEIYISYKKTWPLHATIYLSLPIEICKNRLAAFTE